MIHIYSIYDKNYQRLSRLRSKDLAAINCRRIQEAVSRNRRPPRKSRPAYQVEIRSNSDERTCLPYLM